MSVKNGVRRTLLRAQFGIDPDEVEKALAALADALGSAGVQHKQVEKQVLSADDLAPVILELMTSEFEELPENADEVAARWASVLVEAVGELLDVEEATEQEITEEEAAAMAEEERAYREKEQQVREAQMALLKETIEGQAAMVTAMETIEKAVDGVPEKLTAFSKRLKAMEAQLRLTPGELASSGNGADVEAIEEKIKEDEEQEAFVLDPVTKQKVKREYYDQMRANR